MGFAIPLYQAIAQHQHLRYFSMHGNATQLSWFEGCTESKDGGVQCPQHDFNFVECLLTLNLDDSNCRKVLRQQRVQVRLARIVGSCSDHR